VPFCLRQRASLGLPIQKQQRTTGVNPWVNACGWGHFSKCHGRKPVGIYYPENP